MSLSTNNNLLNQVTNPNFNIPECSFVPLTEKFNPDHGRVAYNGSTIVHYTRAFVEPYDVKINQKKNKNLRPNKTHKKKYAPHFPKNKHYDKQPFENIIHYVDAQDTYCGCCSKIELLDGYDIKVYFPNGMIAQIDEDGVYSVDNQHWGRTGQVDIIAGQEAVVSLPDGTVIDIENDGTYTIDDSKSKTIYRFDRVRDKNDIIASSNTIEKFIEYLGENGAKKEDLNEIPISDFIKWLMWSASIEDGIEDAVLELDYV